MKYSPQRTYLGSAVCTFFFVINIATFGYSQSFTLSFPVSGQNPYTAPIVSVIDHSATVFYDRNHTQVEAYTGEFGKDRCSPSGQPCGYYNPNSAEFIVNGNYRGTTADGADATKVLNYRGHPGYDYGYGQGTPIVASADGVVYIPAADPVNGSDPWCTFHTFYIDHGSGWTTWYLHAADLTITTPHHDCSPGSRSIASDEFIAQVRKGQQVAVVGNFGVPSYHLHFEVRKGCRFQSGKIEGCVVVDPYGWEWTGDDPITSNNLAAVQAAPLWNLLDWNVRQPVVDQVSLVSSSEGFSATITGQNFDSGARVTFWSRSGQYFVGEATVSSVSSTQIVATLRNPPISDSSQYVLKIRNPAGPRSRGVIPTTASGTTSISISLGTGWNLISLPVAPSTNAVATVLSGISGKYDSVWAYDAATGGFRAYRPGSSLSDLSTLDAGRGYWVLMKSSATLTVSGSTPSKSVGLLSGLNLVGYNSLSSRFVSDAVPSLGTKLLLIAAWDNSSGTFKFFIPSRPALSDSFFLEPGKGYYVAVTEAVTWTLP